MTNHPNRSRMDQTFDVVTCISEDQRGNREYHTISRHKTLAAAQRALRKIASAEKAERHPHRSDMPLHIIADAYEIRHGAKTIRYSV